MIKKHPYIVVMAIYAFLFCVNSRANNLNPFYMLQSNHLPVEIHIGFVTVVGLTCLAVGTVFGWVLHHWVSQSLPPVEPNETDRIDYPFEEWQAFND